MAMGPHRLNCTNIGRDVARGIQVCAVVRTVAVTGARWCVVDLVVIHIVMMLRFDAHVGTLRFEAVPGER